MLPVRMVEPSSWTEWSLRDVALFDATVVAVAATSALAANTYFASPSAKAKVAVAEAELRESVLNSPCNGPSIDAIEALEAADAEAAGSIGAGASRPVATDPLELRPLAGLRRHQSDSKRGSGPSMCTHSSGSTGDVANDSQSYDYLAVSSRFERWQSLPGRCSWMWTR